MMKISKTVKIVVCFLSIFLGLLPFTGCGYDGTGRIDNIPNGSRRQTVTVYNDGCCFITKDFLLECRFDDGTTQTLMEWESLRHTALQKNDLSIAHSGPFTIYVSFYYEYSEHGTTQFPVLRCEDKDALLKNGLLLIIGDATINLCSGRFKDSFIFNQSPWSDGFVPEP